MIKRTRGICREAADNAVIGGGADRSSVGTIAKSATVGASAGRWVSTQDSIISQCTGVYHFHSEGRRRTSTIGRSFAALDPAWRHHINNWQQCQEETPRWSSSCMWRGGTTKTQQNRRLGQRHNSWSSMQLLDNLVFGNQRKHCSYLSAQSKDTFQVG